MPLNRYQASLETLLNIPTLHIVIKNIAAKSALRLKELVELRHEHVLKALVQIEFISGDYLIPILNFVKIFKTRIPSREEWDKDYVLRVYAFSILNDGSKTGIGSGVFSDNLYISMSFRYKRKDGEEHRPSQWA